MEWLLIRVFGSHQLHPLSRMMLCVTFCFCLLKHAAWMKMKGNDTIEGRKWFSTKCLANSKWNNPYGCWYRQPYNRFPYNRDIFAPSPPSQPLLATQAPSVVWSLSSSISRLHLSCLPTSQFCTLLFKVFRKLPWGICNVRNIILGDSRVHDVLFVCKIPSKYDKLDVVGVELFLVPSRPPNAWDSINS